MTTLAPRVAPAIDLATAGERTSLKRPRRAVAFAPMACGKMAQGMFVRRVVATKCSPAQKRAPSGFDVKIREGDPAPTPPWHVKERMETEHAARAHKDGARILAAKRRSDQAPSAVVAAKRRKTSSSKPAAQAAHQRAEPAKQQPLLDKQRAAPTATQRPMARPIDKAQEADPEKQQALPDQQLPMSKLIEKAQEVMKRRRLEELACAREKFRLELLEVEKAAMPDETIYPEDLEELGLTAFQYAVTPTRKQAQRRRLG